MNIALLSEFSYSSATGGTGEMFALQNINASVYKGVYVCPDDHKVHKFY